MSPADGGRKTPGSDDAATSEFLSEFSEEYRAIRRGQPRTVPAPERPQPAVSPPADVRAADIPANRPAPSGDGGSADERSAGPSVPAAIGVPPVRVPRGPASPPSPGPAPRPLAVDPAARRQMDRAAIGAALRASESASPAPPPATGVTSVASPRMPERRAIPWGWLILTIAAAVGAAAWPLMRSQSAGTPRAIPTPVVMGSATIASRPPGAEVWIDGERRGATPLTLNLRAGVHKVDVRNGEAVRSLTLEIAPNVAVRETIDLVPTPPTGAIEVTTDVPGAQVSVDGVARGVTPLVVDELAPATYTVTVTSGGTTVSRSVTVPAGGTATVVAAVAPRAAAGGYLNVQAPFEMQVLDRGQVVGTTSVERLMLPAGVRLLELVAEAYEFRTNIAVNIQPGRTSTVPVTVPTGRLSVDAVPWAEVWLDGAPLGATPLANLSVDVGPHEVVWRHPQLGERRGTVRVPVSTTARASVDLRSTAPAP